MKLDPEDRKVLLFAVLILVVLTAAGAAANNLPQGTVTQAICMAFVAALANPIVYILQHFDSRRKANPLIPSTLANPPSYQATLTSYTPTRLRVVVAMLICALSCAVVLFAIQTATNSLLTTMQNLEAEGQLKVTDYGWQVIANVTVGLMTFLVYIPAISFFSIRFSSALGYRARWSLFLVISLAAFLIRALENYGSDLLSVAPTMNAVGANIKNTFSNPRDHVFLLAAQTTFFITLTLLQATYMRLCSWISARRAQSRERHP